MPWKYTAQHPFVFFAPDLPTYGSVATAAERAVIPSAVPDPTFGVVSETASTKGVALTNSMNDNISALLLGRRPLSDYDQTVGEWRSNGGEQIRKELMAVLCDD